MKTFLGGRLGKHEMVQALEIRAELPKTAVGKLSKKVHPGSHRAGAELAGAGADYAGLHCDGGAA
ncbi:MAG TPA: hypothetical protein VFR86_24740, partial [Burkholderiaceae bacterium]|nr:hypothetical protein [Burkholderiaceae bacterium]